MSQRGIGSQPQKLFCVVEISGSRQRAGGQNSRFAGIPQRTAEQLRYAAAGCAECGLSVCGKFKVQDARRHIQEKKAQQAFCFCQPILQVVRHIRLAADVLQNVNAVVQCRLAEWCKGERHANFSSQHR